MGLDPRHPAVRQATARGLIPAGTAAEVVLPVPPPLNNLFLNVRGKGRVKSARYRAWLAAAVPAARALARPPAPCRVALTIEQPIRGDVDGRIKAVLDALVAAQVLADDDRSQVTAVEIAYRPRPGGAGVRVRLTADEPTGGRNEGV